MGIFDFLKQQGSPNADRILAPDQVTEMMTGEYASSQDAIIFVYASSGKPVTPVDLMFLPLLNMEFAKNPHLGMLCGTGSGCALVRRSMLEQIQMHNGSQKAIRSCQAFMEALKGLGCSVKQDPRLDLELLP